MMLFWCNMHGAKLCWQFVALHSTSHAINRRLRPSESPSRRHRLALAQRRQKRINVSTTAACLELNKASQKVSAVMQPTKTIGTITISRDSICMLPDRRQPIRRLETMTFHVAMLWLPSTNFENSNVKSF